MFCSRAFASSVFAAGLTLVIAAPAAAQEAWLNDASRCEIFRALSDIVPVGCAQAGDTLIEPVRTRGWGKTRGLKVRGIRLHDEPGVEALPATKVAAAQQGNPPIKKAINARVQFEFDSFRLSDDAKQALDRLAEVLSDDLMQTKVVQIEGHADAAGPEDYNLTLSQLRARAVRAYLIEQHHIAPDRLPFVGKGELDPYDPAHPTAAVNRRVVFDNLTG